MRLFRISGLNIVQKFSILSFIWVFLFVIVSGWVLTYYLKRNMADLDGGITTSIWLLSVGGGVLFYISFFGMFYRAYRIQKEMDEGIHRLNRELSDLNAHLESLVDERTLALKRSRDDLQAMFDKMVQMEKLSTLGSLVGEIAHQINNPLVGVVNTAQLALMQVEEDGQLKEDLKGIEKAGIECKRIIRKFLDFTRPSRFELSPVDINQLIEGSLEMLEKQLKLRNIAIERRYGEGLPAVDVDTTLMTQVFFNIITNAKDAMPDGGRLAISTFQDGDGLVGITFHDTGTGIEGEDMEKIFSPFFTTKGEGAGTGLGLSVAANIMRSHNGRISAESRVGEGTAFHIRLPINSGGCGNG